MKEQEQNRQSATTQALSDLDLEQVAGGKQPTRTNYVIWPVRVPFLGRR